MKPTSFGRYLLLERIGTGGMAEVFRARTRGSRGLDRLVAIKRIHHNLARNRKFASMFIDEANIAAKLTHANIAQIFDLGKVGNQYFIAMEHIHGRDLRAIFRRHQLRSQALPLAHACYIVMKTCEALDYAHNRKDHLGRALNLVHRDVSLQNLIVSFDGELKIIDFGIAKAIGRLASTETGMVKGKMTYMSPEQLRGLDLDRRSDVFSCGVVLYELVTGERLFLHDNTIEIVRRVRNAEVPRPRDRNPEIPPELEAIVLRALAREPDHRFQSAGEMAEALMAWCQPDGRFLTRKEVAEWMRQLYAQEYPQELARIAAFWSVPDDGEAAPDEPGTDTGAGAEITHTGEIPGGHTAPTVVGWQSPGAGDELDDSIEAETEVFRRPPTGDVAPPEAQPSGPTAPRASTEDPARGRVSLPLPPSPDESGLMPEDDESQTPSGGSGNPRGSTVELSCACCCHACTAWSSWACATNWPTVLMA